MIGGRAEAHRLPIEEDAEYLRMVRLLNVGVFVGGVALFSLDLALNFSHTITVGEAYIITPGVVILLMLSLYLYDSATRSPWKGFLRVDSEFRKSSLMVFGTCLVALGGGLALSSVGGNLTTVTVDMGGGTAVLGAGLYTAWRYRW
jgi:hypothetical protein